MDKIIPVEEDNLEKAIEKAQEIFTNNELTAEYLESRNLDFVENTSIKAYAGVIAKEIYNKYEDNWSYEDVQNYVDEMLKSNEISDYIYEESIEILNNDYSYFSKKINV